jgi:O-antigen/teichoic acid export membrane protein
VRLSSHLDKGFWTLADKAILAAYGLVFMLLVIRTLPEEEYGNFVLVQNAFLILSHLAVSLGLAPYVKHYRDSPNRLPLQSNALLLFALCFLLVLALLWPWRFALGALFNSADFAALFYFLPLLIAASFIKQFTNEVFRASYNIKAVFLTDAMFVLANVIMIGGLIYAKRLDSAYDMLLAMTIAYTCSSLAGFMLAFRQLHFGFRADRRLMRRMFDFGKYTMGSGASSIVYERADNFIIAAYLDPGAVALFNAARNFLRVFDFYRQGLALIAFPAFARLHAERREHDLRALYEKGVFFSNLLLVPVVLAFLLGADFLFDVLLARRYPAGAQLLRWFALLGLFVSWHSVGEGLLFGIGESKYPFWTRLVATLASLALNLVLVKIFGVMGAVCATLVSFGLLAAISTYFVRRQVRFTLRSILSRWHDAVNFARKFRSGA